MSTPTPTTTTALLAGAVAGTTVDLSLFPLDTLKTRLQSREGFLPSGGFRGVYRGVGSCLVGSAPGAAFFFLTYEGVKAHYNAPSSNPVFTHMLAASLGEVAACAVRVPTEVVKQRAQAGQSGGSSLGVLRDILAPRRRGGGGSLCGVVTRELYKGWSITIVREVPFTVIQFPLWEAMKSWSRSRKATAAAAVGGKEVVAGEKEVSAMESGLYGSLAGAVAAGVTTPLDVLKTRVMLSRQGEGSQREGAWTIFRATFREEGWRPFFSGLGPRVMWISIGGAIFLGSYQWVVNAIEGTKGSGGEGGGGGRGRIGNNGGRGGSEACVAG